MDRGALRTLVRSLIDEPSADFWSDAELNTWINLGQRHYVNKIGQAFEHYFGTSSFISYVAGTQFYDLPSDNIRLVRVERVDFEDPVELDPISINDKERFSRTLIAQTTGIENFEFYFIFGGQIGIAPTPDISLTNNIRLFYIQRVPDMTGDSGAGNSPFLGLLEEHHEITAYYAAIQAYAKDEANPALLKVELKELERQLVNSVEDRQVQRPRYVKLD